MDAGRQGGVVVGGWCCVVVVVGGKKYPTLLHHPPLPPRASCRVRPPSRLSSSRADSTDAFGPILSAVMWLFGHHQVKQWYTEVMNHTAPGHGVDASWTAPRWIAQQGQSCITPPQ